MLRHAVNTDTDLGNTVGELFSGWMNAIGIDVQLDAYDQDQLFTVIVDGTYDSFYWGWVPFVDPNPMLSYWTEAELGNYNDANWTNPRYEELFPQQQVEVDPDRRLEIVHEMVRIIHDDAAYIAVWYGPDLQAYRTDKFEGFVQQPAEVGPVLFSQSSPSYTTLRPIGAELPTPETGELSGTAEATATADDGATATADEGDQTTRRRGRQRGGHRDRRRGGRGARSGRLRPGQAEEVGRRARVTHGPPRS